MTSTGTGTGVSTAAKRKRRSSWSSDTLSELGLSGGQQRIVVVIGVVVAVLAAAFGLTLVVNWIGGSNPPAGLPENDVLGHPRPVTYQGWPSLKEFGPIADRKADAPALTVAEIFGAKSLRVVSPVRQPAASPSPQPTATASPAVAQQPLTLRRVATKLDTSCASAVWGEGLIELLSDGGCTQAVRGLYASVDGTYVAQYTLFNLADQQSADEVVHELATLHRGAWTVPLTSDKAAFNGYSEASGQAMGHYAGLVWVGRVDGAEPTAADDFVSVTLAMRDVEKALFKRIVTVSGVQPIRVAPAPSGQSTAQPSEAPPTSPKPSISP
ncbi:hypothetical protein J5X84_04760 [Streptosporangiaceae bacterium NEAU-GS5]|nr:hypothetical protein [Streptosporangiaceae bacterium NEAU-GS5]